MTCSYKSSSDRSLTDGKNTEHKEKIEVIPMEVTTALIVKNGVLLT